VISFKAQSPVSCGYTDRQTKPPAAEACIKLPSTHTTSTHHPTSLPTGCGRSGGEAAAVRRLPSYSRAHGVGHGSFALWTSTRDWNF